jgi:hypothetical protein
MKLKFLDQLATNDKPFLQEIPVSQLNIDVVNYQRETDYKHAQGIAENMWEPALGVLYVNMRKDGTYWVMEGGHRKVAVTLAFGPDYPALCLVYRLSREEESKFFLLMDGRKRLDGLGIYDAGVGSGDRVFCALTEVLEKEGFAIAPKGERTAAKKKIKGLVQK